MQMKVVLWDVTDLRNIVSQWFHGDRLEVEPRPFESPRHDVEHGPRVLEGYPHRLQLSQVVGQDHSTVY